MARLGDICEILDNRRVPITASDRISGPYPYYGANGIQDHVADYIFDDELILLAEDGGNFGSKDKPIAYRVSGKCWVNNHAHVLKPKAGYDIDYVCYSLMYYDVTNLVNGATRQKLTQADMREMVILDRPLKEQKQVAAILGKLNDLISLRKQQLAKLDELVKARFAEMFGDLSVNPMGWKFQKLSTLCDVRDGTHDSPEYVNEGYPLLTSKNFTSGIIDFSDYNLISKADFEKINQRSKVDLGDIIMPMIGTIGHPVIVDTDRPFAIKNVALIKFVSRSISNVFIKTILDSDYFIIATTSSNRGGTQKFIALGDIRNIPIPIVPIELQQQFANYSGRVDRQKLTIQQSLDKLELLKRALMQQYFG